MCYRNIAGTIVADSAYYTYSLISLAGYLVHADYVRTKGVRFGTLVGWSVLYWALLASGDVQTPFPLTIPNGLLKNLISVLLCMTALGAASLPLWGSCGISGRLARVALGLGVGATVITMGPYVAIALILTLNFLVTGRVP